MSAPPAAGPVEESVGDDGLAERVRVLLSVPVAFLASALAVACVVSLPDLVSTLGDLALVDGRFVGWTGVAAAVEVTVAAGALLVVGRVGPGPALSLGAAAAVFGLALAREVVDPFQLTLAQLLLGAAVGCLLAGAASMTFELPERQRRGVMIAWAVPVVSAWPLLTWVSRHVDPLAPGADPRLTYHPEVWVLAPVSAVIVMWSAVAMLVEPPRAVVRSESRWESAWESAWSGLLGCGLAAALATVALGFDPGLPPGWLRPLILSVGAAVIVTLAALSLLLPAGWARIGYVCLVFVLVTFPTTVQLVVLVTDEGPSRVTWWLALLMTVATAAGAGVGAVRPGWLPLAFLVVAAACAGCWVMPDAPGVMAAGALPLCLAMGAVFGAGLRRTAGTAVGWRFGAIAVVVVVALAPILGVGLSWALGGDVPGDVDAARDSGRVFLGITFALAVLAAAVVSVLSPRPVVDRFSDEPARAPSSV